uniref:Neur_chan_LBD domain-containing protein n=2 Tax=Caenorhabditis tropicalis TaxID=1561998 RepID=A0A1I7UH92_9PELO
MIDINKMKVKCEFPLDVDTEHMLLSNGQSKLAIMKLDIVWKVADLKLEFNRGILADLGKFRKFVCYGDEKERIYMEKVRHQSLRKN